MQKICQTCSTEFLVGTDELSFLEKVAPTIGKHHFAIPAPVDCPDCRLKKRVIHRNEQNLYNTQSAQSGKAIVALYSPDSATSKRFKVYTNDEWWADNWDATEYGRDFDFSRPFFEQFLELHEAIPKVAFVQVSNENCPYTTGTGYCKNCHLINSSEYAEDCYYGKLIQSSKNIMDSTYVYDSELCYQCFSIHACYNCNYLYNSQNCRDCSFGDNLKGCANCFLCTNLSNKEYYFLNEPVTKELYQEKIKKFFHTKAGLNEGLAIFDELRRKRVYKYANIISSENSSGDFMANCKNCHDCYDINDSEDCKYVTVGVEVKDLYDCSNMYIKPELNYQVMGTIGTYQVLFSIYIFHSQNVLYSQFCYNSKNLFGCSGLRKKEYCILNKQYTKEQYEELVPKIIAHMQKSGSGPNGEWGQFFPPNTSGYTYNESLAYEYFPISQEQAKKEGYSWKEKDSKDYQPQTYIVPEDIRSVEDTILTATLACAHCSKNYRLIPQELSILRKITFPIPELCPDCRHQKRIQLRNPRKLYERNCMHCHKVITSSFSADRTEHVYCETCYLECLD